ncbi:MAG: hypothetical protein AB7E96_12070 [Deferribacterales bacterium]
MSVNGIQYDWESVEIMMPYGVSIGMTEISYSDERAIEARYGKGSKPRGYGRGNYKASGSITMDKDEFLKLQAACGGSVYDAEPLPILVSYANDDQPTVGDVLPKCVFTKNESSAKQGETTAGEHKLDITILEPIRWNGISAVS